MLRGVALACLLAAATLGCTALRWLRPAFDCPGPELVPSDLPQGFRAQGAYRFTRGDTQVGLRAVLERRADGMALVAFDPVGAPALHVHWSVDGEVDAASELGPLLAVSPLLVARDLRRAWVAGAEEDGVVRTRLASGATRIEHAGCGYTAIVGPPAR